MGGSQSQSYDLSHESMKSLQEKQDIVPSNNIVDGKLIHVISSENSSKNSNILPNTQELQRIHPPEEIPLTLEEMPSETKTTVPKMIETTVE
ncbi:hypothetical protein X798_00267 [Onchocerca flexuosa]|uniref:Ovule protein n=2 Tax=Onchocerca flexuosa TaxID=387005 RepID=A0A183HSX1_9BILA|nr:hypothetical protein X798_00267 [Onchocerca flexuosa]VDO69731.1 unnamed protein product [Onchocerca flexuosa]